MKEKTFEETMFTAIPKLEEYLQEFCQGEKPLGEKAQTKCRAAVHKELAGFVSWLSANGIEWNETQIDNKTIESQIEKGASRFGPKFFSLLSFYVDKWQTSLRKKGKHDLATRLPDTMFVSAKKVLKTDLGAAIDFSCHSRTTQTENKKSLAA